MSVTTDDEACTIVRRLSELVQTGRFEEAVELLHPEFAFREPAQLPYGGVHRGPGALGEVFAQLAAVADVEIIGPIRYLETGGPAVLRMRVRFTPRDGGPAVEDDVVELYTVRDGRIIDADIYYKDPGAVAAALAGPGANSA